MNSLQAVEELVAAAPRSLSSQRWELRPRRSDLRRMMVLISIWAAQWDPPFAVAMGVAEGAPELPVVTILGDSELLMGASSIWSVAGLAPTNLMLAVLTDGLYGITGDQQLVTNPRFGVVAGALGLATGRVVRAGELGAAMLTVDRPALIEAVIRAPNAWERPSPFIDPVRTHHRFTSRLEELRAGVRVSQPESYA